MSVATKGKRLVLNPGSSSRKYGLYDGTTPIFTLHFEFEGAVGASDIICTIEKDGKKEKQKTTIKALPDVANHLEKILKEQGVKLSDITALVARVVAVGEYFTENHHVDEDFIDKLEVVKEEAPLHTPVILDEIKAVQKAFSTTPIIAISDSRFHRNKPDTSKYFAIPREVSDKYGIYKIGYHGISVNATTRLIESEYGLPDKLVVCHIGSGASVSAILKGTSVENSMGFTPVDGVLMASRAGTVWPSALIALMRHLELDSYGIERYLNKEGGLKGLGGTDDCRLIIEWMNDGNQDAKLAYDMYVARLQEEIGRQSAVLGGIDALAFTATIGERDSGIRKAVIKKLAYLGFEINEEKNTAGLQGQKSINIAADGSKPIYVVKTDEAGEMALQASLLS
ncbi:hypothetical protein FWH13_03565 [Candidatus Saccharibacteria bacterium]|nr:hypothetical protein [Candidatus Saccharibacteria bacterium]